ERGDQGNPKPSSEQSQGGGSTGNRTTECLQSLPFGQAARVDCQSTRRVVPTSDSELCRGPNRGSGSGPSGTGRGRWTTGARCVAPRLGAGVAGRRQVVDSARPGSTPGRSLCGRSVRGGTVLPEGEPEFGSGGLRLHDGAGITPAGPLGNGRAVDQRNGDRPRQSHTSA